MTDPNPDIKTEHHQQIIFQHHDYPLENVKLEVDPTAFPPVKWYPIDQLKSTPQKMVSETVNTEQQLMKKFIDILTTTLLQILTPKEKDNFLANYSEFKGQRVYVLIALSFAKWRSSDRLSDFQRILAEQLATNSMVSLSSLPPSSNLYKTMKACQQYLQGDYQKSVDSLYEGSEQSIYMNAISFAEILEKEIKNNLTPKPDFESESKIDDESENEDNEENEENEAEDEDSDSLDDNDEEEMDEEIEEGQEEYERGSTDKKLNHNAEPLFYEYSEPLLISDKNNPIKQYLFPSDPNITFKAHFTDLVKK